MAITGPRGSYDALLLVSFGGPEGPDDVLPFLRNVTRGRGIPDERLAEVAEHYHHFGGVSPINAQNRELLAALRTELAPLDLPVVWGNRNWDPYLGAALAECRALGAERVIAFVTSGYSSYSGCRQYRENLWDAAESVEGAPTIEKLRHWYDHPGFIEPMVDRVCDALDRLGAVGPDVRLVFTTHSIPTAAAATSGPPAGPWAGREGGAYVGQHELAAQLVRDGVAARTGRELPWELVFQSRSGPPHVPWLGPDVSDHLGVVAADGADGVVLVPIGFVSDHIEVQWDLDEVALADAATLGLPAVRAATVGTDPRFVSMVRELVLERVGLTPIRSCTDRPVSHDVCPLDCCPNPRGDRPAAAQAPPVRVGV